MGGDTTGLSARSYHKLRVSPEYFEVFRIKDMQGRDVTPLVCETHRPTVLTRAGEEHFFGGQSAVGRQISGNDDFSNPFTVVAVLPTFRSNDFDRPENCYFSIPERGDAGGVHEAVWRGERRGLGARAPGDDGG